MKVRLAQADDYHSIMELCKLLYKENGARKVNWNTVTDVIIQGINQEKSTLGVIGDVRKVEAMIYIRFASMWYSDEIVLEELYNFVHPDYRKSERAKLLVSFAREASDKIGIPLLIGIISNERTKAKVRLYERIFGEASGAYFLYNAETGRKDE